MKYLGNILCVAFCQERGTQGYQFTAAGDKQSWVNLKEVNMGLGAESLPKVFFHL